MTNPLDDDSFQALLREADRVLEQLRAQKDPDDLEVSMKALDVLYRDLGRSLHDTWQLRASAEPEPVDLEVGIEDLEEMSVAPVQELPESLWVDSLQDLLALMEPPPEEDTAEAVAVEAARVQWGSLHLEQRWSRFPEPIQLALLGMMAARCRWLFERLVCDAGARSAMRRLSAYRRATGLATVVGLMPDHDPEYESWTDDALSWWGMLTAGFQSA